MTVQLTIELDGTLDRWVFEYNPNLDEPETTIEENSGDRSQNTGNTGEGLDFGSVVGIKPSERSDIILLLFPEFLDFPLTIAHPDLRGYESESHDRSRPGRKTYLQKFR